MAWRTGSIIPGVLAHALNNALAFVLTWWGLDTTPATAGAAGVTATILAIASLLALRHRMASLPTPGVEPVALAGDAALPASALPVSPPTE